jgi:hypothetical protein
VGWGGVGWGGVGCGVGRRLRPTAGFSSISAHATVTAAREKKRTQVNESLGSRTTKRRSSGHTAIDECLRGRGEVSSASARVAGSSAPASGGIGKSRAKRARSRALVRKYRVQSSVCKRQTDSSGQDCRVSSTGIRHDLARNQWAHLRQWRHRTVISKQRTLVRRARSLHTIQPRRVRRA